MSLDEHQKCRTADEELCDKSTAAETVFLTINEHRGPHFASYVPARAGDYFASLALVFIESPELSDVPKIMQRECREWIHRYPVPLMVSAFDDTDRLISLQAARGCDHLIGVPDGGEIEFHWKLLDTERFPNGPLTEAALREVYHDVPYTTGAERRERAAHKARAIRVGLLVIAAWVIAGPVAVAWLGFAHPALGVAIVVFSVGKAMLRALKLLGYVPKSQRERQKEQDDLSMRHHHYHCQQNPEGFLGLRAENFQREARENTHKEAVKIAKSPPPGTEAGT